MKITNHFVILDKNGFSYRVEVNHFPLQGVSRAVFQGSPIVTREYGRFLAPATDQDAAWEELQGRFQEQIGDGINSDFEAACRAYFDAQFAHPPVIR